jgi:hypothetical protein
LTWLRLQEPQAKFTSLIPTERLQEISWQDFSHAPRGASLLVLAKASSQLSLKYEACADIGQR